MTAVEKKEMYQGEKPVKKDTLFVRVVLSGEYLMLEGLSVQYVKNH